LDRGTAASGHTVHTAASCTGSVSDLCIAIAALFDLFLISTLEMTRSTIAVGHIATHIFGFTLNFTFRREEQSPLHFPLVVFLALAGPTAY
jgi:hypothetical protein